MSGQTIAAIAVLAVLALIALGILAGIATRGGRSRQLENTFGPTSSSCSARCARATR
jgi:uncharacterized membrane protein YjgN (DUF898 family)